MLVPSSPSSYARRGGMSRFLRPTVAPRRSTVAVKRQAQGAILFLCHSERSEGSAPTAPDARFFGAARAPVAIAAMARRRPQNDVSETKRRRMATDVIMPQMGESIAEGTITKWMKKVGDTVKRDEPI